MSHISVDQHKRFSQVAVLDENGRVLDERRLYHEDKEQLRRYFSSLPEPKTAVLEATRTGIGSMSCWRKRRTRRACAIRRRPA